MPVIVTLDFETYYAKDYTLSKLTTEAYIRDPRYETIGISIAIADKPPVWIPKPKVRKVLERIDWSDAMVVCQNTMFDGAILKWHYGVEPLAWLDIMGMSRALFPHEKSHSLAAQAERMGIGQKGTEVLNALGKRYADFTPEELARYGAYCDNDVHLTRELFKRYMRMGFPKQELKLIDMTLRMFIDAQLELDAPLLQTHLADVVERKERLLDRVQDLLSDGGVEVVGDDGVKRAIMSNDRFANLLRVFDVEPPTKISPTTGKEAYAFAKTDEAFLELQEHPREEVQALVACRLGNRSTIEETRTERFIDMATRGAFPVPLRYYGAHSGRWSGLDSVNLQNLPSRGAGANRIKQSIRAPEGYMLIDCDSSQIEARTLAWLAGQTDLVEAFRRNNEEKLAGVPSEEQQHDVYKLMATKVYGVPMHKVDKPKRQVGKTVILGCIAEGELVLTDCGLVPIEQVSTSMRVWDGVEWVSHDGPIYQGIQEVITYDSITATPDHIVYLQDGSSCRFDEAARSGARIARTGDGGVPVRHGGDNFARYTQRPYTVQPQNPGSLPDLLHGEVDQPYERAQRCDQGLPTMQSTPNLPEVARQAGNGHEATMHKSEPQALPPLRGAGNTLRVPLSAARVPVDQGYLGVTQGVGAGQDQQRWALRTGEPAVFHTPGEPSPHKAHAVRGAVDGVSQEIPGGEVRRCHPEAVVSEAHRRGDCGPVLQPAGVQTKRRVWDLLNAGPRHRFTVSGRLVSNCGYGVGHQKLQAFLKTQASVLVDLPEAKRIIDVYRQSNLFIVKLWRSADTALRSMLMGNASIVDAQGLTTAIPGVGLTLPSGLHIQYPGLEMTSEGMQYYSKGKPIRIYSGKAVENLCQAVARCIVAEQALRIQRRYPVKLMVHDSVVALVPEHEVEEAQAFIEACMRWVPTWAPGLPLACEASVGKTYGG